MATIPSLDVLIDFLTRSGPETILRPLTGTGKEFLEHIRCGTKHALGLVLETEADLDEALSLIAVAEDAGVLVAQSR